MKIYTRTGDSGTTGLFGGDRVSKDHPRIEAYGTVDELNAVVGLARSNLPADASYESVDGLLERIQSDLFIVGADLATPAASRASVKRISPSDVRALESDIDSAETHLPELRSFVLPGGTGAASALHAARTVCRRAERRVVQLAATEEVNEQIVIYLNRLADLLFVLARLANHQAGRGDTIWEH